MTEKPPTYWDLTEALRAALDAVEGEDDADIALARETLEQADSAGRCECCGDIAYTVAVVSTSEPHGPPGALCESCIQDTPGIVSMTKCEVRAR